MVRYAERLHSDRNFRDCPSLYCRGIGDCGLHHNAGTGAESHDRDRAAWGHAQPVELEPHAWRLLGWLGCRSCRPLCTDGRSGRRWGLYPYPGGLLRVVWLKPSRGRVRLVLTRVRNGMAAMSRSVSRALSVTAQFTRCGGGAGGGRPVYHRSTGRPYAAEIGAPVERLRVGFSTASPIGGGSSRR